MKISDKSSSSAESILLKYLDYQFAYGSSKHLQNLISLNLKELNYLNSLYQTLLESKDDEEL